MFPIVINNQEEKINAVNGWSVSNTCSNTCKWFHNNFCSLKNLFVKFLFLILYLNQYWKDKPVCFETIEVRVWKKRCYYKSTCTNHGPAIPCTFSACKV